MTASAERLYFPTIQVAQDTLGHLGVGAVLGAEEEHAYWLVRQVRYPLLSRRFCTAQSGMQGIRRCKVVCAKHIKVKAVVNVEAISGTPSFGHQVLIIQPSQVIGHKILRLLKQGSAYQFGFFVR